MSHEFLKILPTADKKSAGASCSNDLQPNFSSSANAAVHAGTEFGGNVLLVTLGCAKNLVDSEVMLGVLQQKGFRPILDPEAADLIVVNTCAFLESAVKEGVDRILELAEYKEKGRCRRLVVAGCMVERYRKDLQKSLPEVDRFISTDELLSVADEELNEDSVFDEARRPYFLYDETMPRLISTAGHSAYIKISEGCDRPCAFCIIPKIRGAFRSRKPDSIVREASDLLRSGVREINLIAQDLTAYGSDLTGSKSLLADLISAIDNLRHEHPHFWTRLFYAYPVGVTENLIKLISSSAAICNYLDLPLQHISHAVLKRMNRPLGERGTRGLIEQIRKLAPEIALRTTFVVGFPGETEEDIKSLEQFVSEGHFTHVGTFTYSQEKEAKSFNFPDQIPESVKKERRARIMECQQKVVASRLKNEIGKEIRVLVDGHHQESNMLLVGRAEWQGPETDGDVIINDLAELVDADNEAQIKSLTGKFATVRITEVAGYDLVGTLSAVE